MLPYTPLHHLLMAELGFPIVATSGNLADEPICIDEREALQRLKGIGEVFLVHNRPIRRHVDDSIVRVIMGRELVLRRARGYAPLPVHLSQPVPAVVAVGAHLKSAVSIAVGQEAFVSQHLGDLETSQALMAFRQVTADLQQLYGLQPETVACDQHPDYLSTQYARDSGLHVVAVQHHYAHVLSCMAENQLEGPVLGVSWDGTGYGTDSTIWGGEFLCVKGDSFERAAHLRKFRLPGGEQAIKEPRRAALGVLYEVFGDELFSMPDLAPVRAFSERELQIVEKMLRNDINAPITSSAGRLFDAVSAIAGLRQHNRFEGQGAMELEFCLQRDVDDHYDFEFVDGESSPGIVDWAPLVRGIVENLHRGLPAGKISARFHNTLAEAIVAVARMVGRERVVLTGGCFQNRYLTERAVQRLQEADFRPYWHQRIPPNDGGIALGQIAAVARSLKLEQKDVSGCPR